jgi:hypothetical protein
LECLSPKVALAFAKCERNSVESLTTTRSSIQKEVTYMLNKIRYLFTNE